MCTIVTMKKKKKNAVLLFTSCTALETAVAHHDESTPQTVMPRVLYDILITRQVQLKSNLKNTLENTLFRFHDFCSILGNVVKLVDTINPLKQPAVRLKKKKVET